MTSPRLSRGLAIAACGAAMLLTAAPTPAQESTRAISYADSFPIGSNGLCEAQILPPEAGAGLFDRSYAIVCRDAAAPVGGRHLGQVQRAGDRRRTHPEAEHDACRHHQLHVGGHRTAERADQEQARADQQAALAPDAVGHPATEQRTECRPREQQRADHRRLAECAELQVVLHVEQGTGDDAGVVTEQQTTECGDDGQLGQESS